MRRRVRRERDRVAAAPTCRVGRAGGGLPVADLQLRDQPRLLLAAPTPPGAGRDEDAAGGEGAVVQAAPVGVRDGFCELADHREAAQGVELVAVLGHVVVEPHGARIVAEDQRRPGLVRLHRVDADDAGVVDAVQHHHLALRGALDARPFGLHGVALDEVDADAPVLAFEVAVAGVVVLPGRAEVERSRLQLPRADLVVLPAARDTDGVQQVGQGRGQLLRDAVALIQWRALQQRTDRG